MGEEGGVAKLRPRHFTTRTRGRERAERGCERRKAAERKSLFHFETSRDDEAEKGILVIGRPIRLGANVALNLLLVKKDFVSGHEGADVVVVDVSAFARMCVCHGLLRCDDQAIFIVCISADVTLLLKKKN